MEATALILLALAIRCQPFHHFPKWQIVSIELALIGLCIFLRRKHLGDLFLNVRNFRRDLAIGLAASLTWVIFELELDRLSGAETGPVHLRSLILFPVVILIVGWASSLYEELLFRSLVLSEMIRRLRRPSLAIVLQGLLFGVAHWGRYFHAGQWHHALSTTLFGIILGILTWRTRSLLPAWIVHTIDNSYGVVFMEPETVIDQVVSSWLR